MCSWNRYLKNLDRNDFARYPASLLQNIPGENRNAVEHCTTCYDCYIHVLVL